MKTASGPMACCAKSGAGLVVKMTGLGRVYVQTLSPSSLIDRLVPELPAQLS
jgi:uncharacterized protein (AIM24 family)